MNQEEQIKADLLEKLLTSKKIDSVMKEKLSFHSYHTKNFCYIGVRIGNSIGDQLENGVKLKLLELTANKYELPFNSIDHGEIHSTSISEEGALELVEAVIYYENLARKPAFMSSLHTKIDSVIEREFLDI